MAVRICRQAHLRRHGWAARSDAPLQNRSQRDRRWPASLVLALAMEKTELRHHLTAGEGMGVEIAIEASRRWDGRSLITRVFSTPQ